MFPSASIFLCSRLGEALELVRPYPNQLQRIVYRQVEDPADCRRPGPDPALTSQAQRRRRRNARTASTTQPTSTIVTKTTQIGSSGGIARPPGSGPLQVGSCHSSPTVHLPPQIRHCRRAVLRPGRFDSSPSSGTFPCKPNAVDGGIAWPPAIDGAGQGRVRLDWRPQRPVPKGCAVKGSRFTPAPQHSPTSASFLGLGTPRAGPRDGPAATA